MKSQVKNLINQFVSETRALVGELCAQTGMEISAHNVATVLKTFPREGVVPSGASYRFHGIGCRFEKIDGTVIDFDFGPGPARIGFDEFRLCEFSASARKNEDISPQALKSELVHAQDTGELEKLTLPVLSHLFFLKESSK